MANQIAGPLGEKEPKDLVFLEMSRREDNEGNSILQFTAETGYIGCCDTEVIVWAKRIVDGKNVGLTDSEKQLFEVEDVEF